MEADHGAPICQTSEIVIDATAEVVWDTLTDFNTWPGWMPGVKTVTLHGPVRVGTTFEWKAGPGTIRSEILESSRPRSIGWKGRTFGIAAMHVWRIEGHGPAVRTWTEESWDGLLARVLRASLTKTVKKALDDGLAALKSEAERRGGSKHSQGKLQRRSHRCGGPASDSGSSKR